MQLFKLTNIRHESGFCYLADLPSDVCIGEGSESPRKSSLQLFESGVELGPGSAAHKDIREIGGGAFSHWGRSLYFSSSDNANPLKSAREYVGVACTSIIEEKQRDHNQALLMAGNPHYFGTVLASSANAQGAEVHSLFSLRLLLARCRGAGIDITEQSCLEIGSSPSCGLAIALGLLGVKHLFINNVVKIDCNKIDLHFAQSIAVLTNLVLPTRRTLEDVVLLNADGEHCRLNPSVFTDVSGLDAAMLADRVQDVDFMFSFSVLEHIRHLAEVMRVLRVCGNRKCQAVHFVDLRDHTDFARPLKFLYLTDEEFARRYTEEHNRSRLSDYLRVFSSVGWEIGSVEFVDRLPLLESGGTDLYQTLLQGPERFLKHSQNELTEAISQEEINRLAPEFRTFSPEELSVLIFSVTLSAAG